MTDPTGEPLRLLDDPTVGAALRGDLASATDVAVEGLDFAKGLGVLEASIAAEAGATGVIAPIAVGSSSTILKVASGVVLAGGLALWLGTRGDDGDAGAPMRSAAIEVASPVETPEEPVGVVPPVAQAPTVPAPIATPPAPAPAVVPEEIVVVDPDVEEPVAPTVRKKKHLDTAPLSAEDAMREASLVSRARAALDSSPKQALSLTRQAASKYPGGMLGEEREAIAIQALAKLGRSDEAARRGARFLSAHAHSPHAAAVRRAIGG